MSIRITSDDGRKAADNQLREMSARLRIIYSRADTEITKKAKIYFDNFIEADEKKRKLLAIGKITEKEYKKWRKSKLLYGKRFSDLKKSIAERMTDVNQTALSYINGEMPKTYMANYNSMGTDIVDTVNKNVDAGISFDLVDEDTVRILAEADRNLLPRKTLDIPKDKRWNMRLVQSEVLQGIIQGESIPKIAARLSNVTDMNRAAAIRNARTMVTGAENRGRLDGMQRAFEHGILLDREWVDAGDRRVRDLHAMLDGQIRSVDEPFDVEGYVIMYPGDPSARPELVYNCRCTTCAVIRGFRNSATGKVVKL